MTHAHRPIASPLALILPLALTALAPTARAAPAQVETKPAAVTVFAGSALVERTGTTPLAEGLHRLIVAGLPARTDDASVRVRVRGEGKPRLVGFAVEDIPSAEIVSTEARALEAEQEKLQDEGQALVDARSVVSDRRAFVRALLETLRARLTSNMALGPIDLATLGAISAFGKRRTAELGEADRKIDADSADVARRSELVRRKLAALQSKREKQTKAVTVDVRAPAAGDVALEVRYVVPGASWRSVYDAFLDNGAVRFVQHAIVRQETGEDWEGVALRLSSAAASNRVAVPELFARYVTFQPPYRPRPAYRGYYRRPSAMKAPAPAGPRPRAERDGEREEMAGKKEVFESVATTRVSEFAATYAVDGRASVASDGAPRKITIGLLPLEAEVVHEATPRLSAGANLLAKGKYTGAVPLLPGAVSLHIGKDYVGESHVGFVGTGAALKLPFGRDDRLRVQRSRVTRLVHDQGVFTKEYKIDYVWRFEVENLVGREVKLSLLDLIPVSTDERIKIELDASTTPASASLPEDARGVLRWELRLQPGEKRELRLAYSVTYPRNLSLYGLE